MIGGSNSNGEHEEVVGQFNAAKAKMESLLEEKQSKLDRIEILNAFIASLEDKAVIIDEFSTDLWKFMILVLAFVMLVGLNIIINNT